MSFALDKVSESRLVGVHPDLIIVVRGAAMHYKGPGPFVVFEGLRNIERQRELFQAGRTLTMKSRHLTGHAVDLVPKVDTDNDGDLELSWSRELFFPIVDAMRASASAAGILIEWGGDWKSLVDMPHWQLPRSKYP